MTTPRTRTSGWSTGCWRRRASASGWRACGCRWRATPRTRPTRSAATRSSSTPTRTSTAQWVIEAFNRDLPYDRFLQLPARRGQDRRRDAGRPGGARVPGARARSITTATGSAVKADEWEDRVDTVIADDARADRRLRPLPRPQVRPDLARATTTRLAGVFASTRMVNQTAGRDGAEGRTEAPKVDPGDVPRRRGRDAAGPERLHPRERRPQGAGRPPAVPGDPVARASRRRSRTAAAGASWRWRSPTAATR